VTGDLQSSEAPQVHELEQRLLDENLELIGELRGEVPAIRARHELLGRINESAEARKAGVVTGPQSPVVKLGQGVERIELAAVGIAAVVRQLLQLAKDGSVHCSAQGGLHLRHRHDSAPPKQGKQSVRFELWCAHNVLSQPLKDELRHLKQQASNVRTVRQAACRRHLSDIRA